MTKTIKNYFMFTGFITAMGLTSLDAMAAECYISSGKNITLNIGNYEPKAHQPQLSYQKISVTCQTKTAQTIKYRVGLNTYNNSFRTLTHTIFPVGLNYNIYTTSNYENILKDIETNEIANNITNTIEFVLPGMRTESHNLYFLVTPKQTVPPGDYQETITLEIVY